MRVFLYSSGVGEVPKDVAGDGSGGLKTELGGNIAERRP